MNLTPTQVIIIGCTVVFGIPIAVGIVLGHFLGGPVGFIAGIVIFATILTIVHRQLTKKIPPK